MKKSGFALLVGLSICHFSSLAQVGKVGINTTSPAAMLHVMDSSVVFTAPATLPPTPALPPVSGQGIRMMWYAEKGAFRTGRVQGPQWDRDSIGVLSFAAGLNTKAKGAQSVAMGNGANAVATGSVAIGSNTNATGGGSLAMGTNTTASGNSASAFGSGTAATGSSTTAMGSNSIASGNISTAMGASTMATGNNSTAMGASSKAMGVSSTAMGNGTLAMGTASTSAGFNTKAMGSNSTALGLVTQANGFSSLTLGQYNDTIVAPQSSITATTPLLIVGNGDPGMPSNALVIRKDGRVGIGTNDPASTLDINGQLKMSGGSPAAGKVLTSDATGLATWETPSTGADNLGNHMATENIQANGFYISNDGEDEGIFVDTTGRVGIGTNNPLAPFHVEEKNVFFRGKDVLPGVASDLPDPGNGHRFLWYADKVALRSTNNNASEWHKDSIGLYSIGVGSNVKAIGGGSAAFGVSTHARANYSFAAGLFTKAESDFSVAFGFNTMAKGSASFANGYLSQATGNTTHATGFQTKAEGSFSATHGHRTQANGYASLVIGMFNDTIVSPQSIVSSQTPLLIVGNGDAFNMTSNAMVVQKDGRVGIGTNSPAAQLHVKNKSVVFEGPATLPSPSPDPPISGPGVRMMWYPEKAAFRAGIVEGLNWNKDSIGLWSIGLGYDPKAVGNGSAVLGGLYNRAGASYATVSGGLSNSAFGHASTVCGGSYVGATGLNSFAGAGYLNKARGDYSFLGAGYENEALGDYAFLGGGYSNNANGDYSTIMGGESNMVSGTRSSIIGGSFNTVFGDYSSIGGGRGLFAYSYGESVIGLYNTIYTPVSETAFDPTDRLFVVANGTNGANRSNALTMLKNGKTGFGTSTPGFLLELREDDDAYDGPIMAFRGQVADQFESGRIRFLEGTSSNNFRGAYILYNGQQNHLVLGVHPTSDNLTSNDEHVLIIDRNDSYVGIGMDPSFQFQIYTNSAAKPTSNTWTVASDARLKKNVHAYTDGLEAVLKINPVWFTYTGEGNLPEDTGVGVLAQELQEIAPYMVGTWSHKTEDGQATEYLSVDNGAMTYMLINAVKEQQQIIDTQQNELDELKKELAELRLIIEHIRTPKSE